jgi:hypothetical protein
VPLPICHAKWESGNPAGTTPGNFEGHPAPGQEPGPLDRRPELGVPAGLRVATAAGIHGTELIARIEHWAPSVCASFLCALVTFRIRDTPVRHRVQGPVSKRRDHRDQTAMAPKACTVRPKASCTAAMAAAVSARSPAPATNWRRAHSDARPQTVIQLRDAHRLRQDIRGTGRAGQTVAPIRARGQHDQHRRRNIRVPVDRIEQIRARQGRQGRACPAAAGGGPRDRPRRRGPRRRSDSAELD